MRTITLDLENIETVRALHIYLAYKLNLPDYYGRNLDALHDCLTDIGEDTAIAFSGTACGEVSACLPRLLRVFEDAAGENVRLKLV